MPVALVLALAVGLIIVAKKISTPLAGASQGRVQQLAAAISEIEGGSESNPGNIRDLNTGAIAQSGDLVAKLNYDFVNGFSVIYSPDMTFTQFAWMYVAGTTPGNWAKVTPPDNPDTWAAYVASKLGVTVDSTVGDFLQS